MFIESEGAPTPHVQLVSISSTTSDQNHANRLVTAVGRSPLPAIPGSIRRLGPD